jgi:hypothetical protein
MAFGPFNVGGGSARGGGSASSVIYDNSNTHIAASNVQDAIDTVLDATLPTLTITAPAGSALVITNGSTVINGTSGTDGTFTTKLPNTGTWTIQASKDGESTDGTVNAAEVGGNYTITLAYFAAVINVMAVAGAVVKAVCGSDTFSATAASNGKAAITVKKAGTYTVSGTYGGAGSNTASVNVTTNGASYTATVKFITLTVTAPAGSTITAKNGSTTKTGTGGTVTFYLPNTGTWAVQAMKDGETADDTVSVTAYQAYSVELAYVKIYGVVWDKSSKTTLTRTDDAALFTDPVPSVGGAAGSSPFDNCLPWSGMVKENRTGGVMVKIPKFWYKWTDANGTLKLQIADKAVSGFHVSPAHADRGDGKGERDYVYIGRYKCAASTYKSESGKRPQVSQTRASFRTSIHNLGSNIWQQDFAMFWTTRMLYLVEYANWDGQAAIGFNCGNNSSTENMGTTDSMTYHTGTKLSSKTTYGTGVQYRWIEDPWGNVLEWCDGIYFSGSNVYCIKNPASFSDSSGGTKTGTRPTSGGYISAWGVPTVSGFEYALYPSAVAGSETTYIADYCGYGSSGVVLYVGGYYDQGRNHGPFCLSGAYTASSADGYIGSRLQELP